MKVLIVEDNPLLGKSMKRGLEEAGFVVDLSVDGDEGIYHIETAHYDLILLDWMLPQISGIDLLAGMRKKGCNTPTIMITAKGVLGDRLQGFQSGADDYLVKPFEMSELILRMKALYRRSVSKGSQKIVLGTLVIDLDAHSASVNEEKIEMTTKELELLILLASKPNQLVKRQVLTDSLYHMNEEPESNSLDVLLARVRKKLSGSNVEIVTVRGKGFTLNVAQTST